MKCNRTASFWFAIFLVNISSGHFSFLTPNGDRDMRWRGFSKCRALVVKLSSCNTLMSYHTSTSVEHMFRDHSCLLSTYRQITVTWLKAALATLAKTILRVKHISFNTSTFSKFEAPHTQISITSKVYLIIKGGGHNSCITTTGQLITTWAWRQNDVQASAHVSSQIRTHA